MSPGEQFINEITDPERGGLIIVSTLACICFVIVTVSQFVKCLKTKNTTSLSMFFAVILPITNTLITIYDLIFFCIGLNNGHFVGGLLLPAIINGLISAYGVMILKIKHVRAAKKLGLTEEKYYQKYLKHRSGETKKKKDYK